MFDTGTSALAGQYESRADTVKTPDATLAYWLAEDALAEKQLANWRKRTRKIVKRYRDERETAKARRGAKLNILWANVETMSPVLYARTPKPDVGPRWKDNDEPVVRLASEILDRELKHACDAYDFDSVMRHCVQARLLGGMGVARVRYVPSFGEPGGDDEYAAVEGEEARCDYVNWEDFCWSAARTWEEVRWVRFRAYMTRDELIARFGAVKGKKVNLDWTPRGMDGEGSDVPDVFKKATVREFWDRASRKAIWIADGYSDGVLDSQPDPLGLTGFFPCPKPLFATMADDKCVPVPDFAQYQDQANALDVLTTRIEHLENALVVKGAYPAAEKDTITQLVNATETVLIPVADWALFGSKTGSSGGFIVWWPIEQIAKVLAELYVARESAKQALYEVTGLSDIMRGATKASETLGAQQLKSQYGTIRVQDSQKDVQRFARDLFRLLAEVMAEHFAPETVSAITGLPELPKAPQPPPAAPGTGQAAPGGQGAPVDPNAMLAALQAQQQAAEAHQVEIERKTAEFAQAIALLKSDRLRGFRVDVETDSTIAPDEQAEKEARVEFLTAIGTLIANAMPLIEKMPQAGEFVGEALKFAAHGFRAGRPLVEILDRFVESVKALPPPGPSTDPALEKLKADAAVDMQRAAHAAKMAEAKLASEQALAVQKMQNEAAIQQQKMALAKQEADDNLALELMKIEGDQACASRKTELDNERADRQFASDDGRAAAKAEREAETAKSKGNGAAVSVQYGSGEEMKQFVATMSQVASAMQTAAAVMQESVRNVQRARPKGQKIMRDKGGRALGSEYVYDDAKVN